MGVFTGSFVEAAFFSKQWTMVAGARVDTWHLPPHLTLVSVDPRLEVRFKPIRSAHGAGERGARAPGADAPHLAADLRHRGAGLGAAGGRAVQPRRDAARCRGCGLELSGDVFYNHLFQAREREPHPVPHRWLDARRSPLRESLGARVRPRADAAFAAAEPPLRLALVHPDAQRAAAAIRALHAGLHRGGGHHRDVAVRLRPDRTRSTSPSGTCCRRAIG